MEGEGETLPNVKPTPGATRYPKPSAINLDTCETYWGARLHGAGEHGGAKASKDGTGGDAKLASIRGLTFQEAKGLLVLLLPGGRAGRPKQVGQG